MDAYTIRARLLPAFLSALPVGIALAGVYPDGFSEWGALWSTVVAAGGTYLIAELGRDAGRNRESALFGTWGGQPTTLRLRHRDAPNPLTVAHYHERLSLLRADLVFPSPADEARDPDAADKVYESATQFLRDSTRDHSKFHLVFEGLCEYGFRRNLWGLKLVGLPLALGSLTAPAAGLIGHARGFWTVSIPAASIALVLTLGFSLVWVVFIRPDWVKTTAFAYADRLLGAVETLGPDSELNRPEAN